MNEEKIVAYLCDIHDDPHLYYEGEFITLLNSAGYSPTCGLDQNVKKPNPHTYFSATKLQLMKSLLDLARNNDCITDKSAFTCVAINVDLSPVQKNTLEEILGLPVIDRTFVILQIFERNARTKEAKLQVEIARLEYDATHLIDTRANYSQVTSGSGHNKGAGETEIELNRRQISRHIYVKKQELEEIKKARRTTRLQRNQTLLPKIAVVGYTNAGKSSLINAFLKRMNSQEKKNVLVRDDLFVTIQTSTRMIDIHGYPSFYLTDTVGFISSLPSYLLDAFRSTLEEIKEADYILQVVDISDPEKDHHIATTEEVLEEIGCVDIPILYLLNKFDKLQNKPNTLPKENELFTSLVDEGESIDDILHFLAFQISKEWEKKSLILPYSCDYHLFSSDNYVLKCEEKDDGYHCLVKINPQTIYKYKKLFN